MKVFNYDDQYVPALVRMVFYSKSPVWKTEAGRALGLHQHATDAAVNYAVRLGLLAAVSEKKPAVIAADGRRRVSRAVRLIISPTASLAALKPYLHSEVDTEDTADEVDTGKIARAAISSKWHTGWKGAPSLGLIGWEHATVPFNRRRLTWQ